MALFLDPTTPVLWRSPHALQIGVERNVELFEPLSALDETLIAALRRGVSASGLAFVARSAGGTDADAERMRARLRGHLATVTPVSSERIVLDGDGPASLHIVQLLRSAGIPIELSSELPDFPATPDLVILQGRFALRPSRYRQWLGRDIAHLPVLFGERAVTIGPLVRPGNGPCLYCLELHRTDADPCWPVLATQLAGSPARSESPTAALTVAARLAAWLSGPARQRAQRFAARSVHIDVRTGRVSREKHRPHAACGCRSLPENGSAPAANAAHSPAQTS